MEIGFLRGIRIFGIVGFLKEEGHLVGLIMVWIILLMVVVLNGVVVWLWAIVLLIH